MNRMPGRASQPWCPYCHAPPGLDCPDRAKGPRQIRRALKRDLERELLATLAELEEQEDDPGVADDLLAEHEEFATLRARATSQII